MSPGFVPRRAGGGQEVTMQAGLFIFFVCSGFRSALTSMEAGALPQAEDRAEDPGSRDEGGPDCPPGGQSPDPTVLWDTLERKFLEHQQVTHRTPEGRQRSLLSLLPLFLKVSVPLMKLY